MSLHEKALRVTEMAHSAFTAKGDLNQLWQNIADLHMPEQADFTVKRDPHQFGAELYDCEPARQRRDFCNWIGSVLRPKGREWFRGRFREPELNDEHEIMEFLQMQDKRHRMILYDDRAGGIQQWSKADHDYGTFGNSVTYVDKNTMNSGFLFRTCHLRDSAWMDNQDGDVDTMFRKLNLKVKQVVGNQRKRNWTVPKQIIDLMDKEPNKEISIIHVQLPSDHYHWGDKPKHKDRDFVNLYIAPEFKAVLWEDEIHTFQYHVSRWYRLSGSPYALSPCSMLSQPDAQSLQRIAWSIMQAGELAVEPPLIGQSEVVLSPVNLFAAGVTWVDKAYDERMGQALRPVELGRVPDIGVALMQGLKEAMGSTWYLNKLMLPQVSKEMTATEVERRYEEFLRATQPIIEPAEPERNGKMLQITHQMAWRAGWMGSEMPEQIEGKEIEWSYDNPIEDARKKATVTTFQSMLETTMAAMQLDPALPVQLDMKTAYRETISAIAPAEWMHEEDSDEIKEAEKAAEEQAQNQQAMAEVGQGMEIAKTANDAGLLQ